MKKLTLVLGLILLMAGPSFADDVAPLNYVFAGQGTVTDNTFKATLDNTAQSFQTLAEAAGITWLQYGRPPQAVTVSIETNAARYGGTGTDAATTTGHVIAVGSSAWFSGEGKIRNTKLCNAVAGSNAVAQITLER